MSEKTLNSDLNNHLQPVGLSMELFKREGIGSGQGIKERAHTSKVVSYKNEEARNLRIWDGNRCQQPITQEVFSP